MLRPNRSQAKARLRTDPPVPTDIDFHTHLRFLENEMFQSVLYYPAESLQPATLHSMESARTDPMTSTKSSVPKPILKKPSREQDKYYQENNYQRDFAETGFAPFHKIIKSKSDWVRPFIKVDPDDKRHFLTTQLKFNSNQSQLFSSQMQSQQKNQFGSYLLKVRQQKQNIQRMPAIRINKLPPQKTLRKGTATRDIEQLLERQELAQSNKGQVVFYGSRQEVSGWRPPSRENSRLCQVGGKALLYGGICSDMLGEVSMFDPVLRKWLQLPTQGETALLGRIGHSAHASSPTELLIFGGESRQKDHAKGSNCLNDTRLLDIPSRTWTILRTSGPPVEPRRNHASCLVGRTMLVSGGVGTHHKYLCDLAMLDLDTHRWTKLEYTPYEPDHSSPQDDLVSGEGIAFHTMCAVFRLPRAKLFQSPTELSRKERKVKRYKEEGIYSFGGKDSKNNSYSQLRILETLSQPLRFTRLDTTGRAPGPRHSHSMDVVESTGMLILYGGRNDFGQHGQVSVLADLFVLDLFSLQWQQVQVDGLTLGKACSHATSVHGSTLLIFGGHDLFRYTHNTLLILETNQKKATEHRNKVQSPPMAFWPPLQVSLEEKHFKNKFRMTPIIAKKEENSSFGS